ncbi:hypothetical protein GPECTOR_1g480 [Gonium pectorale]|uniref:Uncharacterized protein n=1 Tax=Gonium pectorale TaxID=33097 RepID=A0A150H3D8_GONPE|nr:hypothetical protein GPECTOR_1g480 [Gonium pectorale]|eukprot:KXZ56535.1 hypothetical protein GPECTOR_1g480 [Gonium pectorale]
MSSANAPPAGLSSGRAHIAHDRWDPVKSSYEFTELPEHHVRPQPVITIPQHTSGAYTNGDIEHSHPTNRPILACTGLPRAFKVGTRCVNPLEPRYHLPGTSSPTGGVPSPKAAGSLAAEASWGALPSPSRNGGERLLAPALSVPRSADGPRLQPLASPSSAPHAQHGDGGASTPKASGGSNSAVTTNGAVGGLLLYGPTATPVSAGDRCLDVADINGRRSSSVPQRRGGFDPLNVTDIVSTRVTLLKKPVAIGTRHGEE